MAVGTPDLQATGSATQVLICVQNKNPKAMEEYQRKLAGIWKRNNCHPVKSILPILVQAPVFIGFFTSLQSLARAKVAMYAWLSCPAALL